MADAGRLKIAFSRACVTPTAALRVEGSTRRGLPRSPDGAGASGVGANGDGRGECTEGSENEQGPHHDRTVYRRIMASSSGFVEFWTTVLTTVISSYPR